MKTIITKLGAAAVLGAVALGCATTPVPADKYARSKSAIRGAEVMNAEKVPGASTHLALAKQNLEKGKSMLQNGETVEAGYFLLRAEADADAAMNLAREAWARDDAERTIAQVEQAKARIQKEVSP